MDMKLTPVTPANPPPAQALKEAAMRRTAEDLEATFLSEMLKHTGIGETPEEFGGGVGEDQFSSLLRDEQARIMAHHGGIGLAEAIFNSLKERSND